MRRLDGIINSVDMTLNKLRRWGRIGKPGVLLSMERNKEYALSVTVVIKTGPRVSVFVL